MKRSVHAFAACLAIGLVACRTPGSDVDRAVARIIQGVSDDAQRAQKLVESAKTLELDKALVVGILERAVDCAMRGAGKTEGLEAGLEALRELDKRADDRRSRWAEKRLALCRRGYDLTPEERKPQVAPMLLKLLEQAGDRAAQRKESAECEAAFAEALRIANATAIRRLHFESKQAEAAARLAAERKVRTLRQRLAKTPDSRTLQQNLMEAILIDLDDPKQARGHVTSDSALIWRTYVPMATKDPRDLPENACLDVCNFYQKSLAPKAAGRARLRMLRRARRYCQIAIEKHEKKDLALMEAQDRLKAIDREIRRLGPVGSMLARLRYVDLLRLVDFQHDASQGNWLVRKGTFVSSTKPKGTLWFPVDTTGSYQLSLSLRKTQTARDVFITFPVLDRDVEMKIHEYYAPASSYGTTNVTWLRLTFERMGKQKGTKLERVMNLGYRSRKWGALSVEVAVKVTGEKVSMVAGLNRARWLSWSGHKDSISEKHRRSDRPFSIRFDDPGILVSAARLRPVDGEVVLVGREWQELWPASKDDQRDPGDTKLPGWEDFRID